MYISSQLPPSIETEWAATYATKTPATTMSIATRRCMEVIGGEQRRTSSRSLPEVTRSVPPGTLTTTSRVL
ncbi:hypothetical protein ACIBL5_10120 [Streptomyces sp. NPDC050516]|uniref:hypothetical protein n=1 Tax=Streptomyces sp. NPDC050516 TaxID=3365621 RepID=UPI0037B08823